MFDRIIQNLLVIPKMSCTKYHMRLIPNQYYEEKRELFSDHSFNFDNLDTQTNQCHMHKCKINNANAPVRI